MCEDDDQPRESDPIRLNVFGQNQSALYKAVSEADMSGQPASEGEYISRVLSKSETPNKFLNFILYPWGKMYLRCSLIFSKKLNLRA